MPQYLYFSYYDSLMECVGFNIIPSPVENPTPSWVQENISVTAPVQSVMAVVSLDTSPPQEYPVWIEFFEMSADYGQEN